MKDVGAHRQQFGFADARRFLAELPLETESGLITFALPVAGPLRYLPFKFGLVG